MRVLSKYLCVTCPSYDACAVQIGCVSTISKNQVFTRLFPDAPRRQQERESLFLENSAIYGIKTETLLKTKSILWNRCTGFVIEERKAVGINEPMDLMWVESLMNIAD